ncbi:MAG: hypothetical protein AVDCRST_MAG40-395, partial [uncultured Gemmatimonadaceae bacterium]
CRSRLAGVFASAPWWRLESRCSTPRSRSSRQSGTPTSARPSWRLRSARARGGQMCSRSRWQPSSPGGRITRWLPWARCGVRRCCAGDWRRSPASVYCAVRRSCPRRWRSPAARSRSGTLCSPSSRSPSASRMGSERGARGPPCAAGLRA